MVVGVDGTPAGESALRWAAEHARRIGAELILVAVPVWPTGPGIVTPPGYDPDGEATLLVEAAAASVKDRPIRVRTLVVRGVPGAALVRESRDAALLVLGRRGRGVAGAGTLLGTVSSYCVNHAYVPVVVVPSPTDAPQGDPALPN